MTAQDLSLIKSLNLRIVALDGGANHLKDTVLPDLIIGDLDSVEDVETWRSKTHVIEVADQNFTDLEKALTHELAAVKTTSNESTPLFICFGLLGGRFDQSLTVLHTCLKFTGQPMIFISEEDLVLTVPVESMQLDLPVGARVSLFPLSPSRFGSSQGLLYPLDDLDMKSGTLIGTSNEASESQVKIDLRSGVSLLILDRVHQDLVLSQLVQRDRL